MEALKPSWLSFGMFVRPCTDRNGPAHTFFLRQKAFTSSWCLQVRSHAQKFFLKLEKSGQADVVPPPRPKKRAAKPYPVQDRSEERRKSKRSRTSNSNSSAHSQPSHSRGCLTPGSSPSNGRSSPRSAATAATAPGSSSRPLRSTRVTRGLAQALKGSSQDLEGASNVMWTMGFFPYFWCLTTLRCEHHAACCRHAPL